MPNVVYVSYYDCSNWISSIEVMNLQQRDGVRVRIDAYSRDGVPIWVEERRLNRHETVRYNINNSIQEHIDERGIEVSQRNREGLIVISPMSSDSAGNSDEFAAMLIIRDEGRDWKEANRFVPFTRVVTDNALI